MSNFTEHRKSECGSAGTKLIMVLLVLFLIAHAGYNYIPVAYEGENFKQEMQTAVVQAVAMPGSNLTPADTVKIKLKRAVLNNNIPDNALIEVKPINNVIRARVSYVKPVNMLPFGIYKYNYRFDNTVTPTGFLFKDDVQTAQQ
ncbi:MAG: hypothetical protein ABIP06_00350 [Pyrinomonadaceae bacterium]